VGFVTIQAKPLSMHVKYQTTPTEFILCSRSTILWSNNFRKNII